MEKKISILLALALVLFIGGCATIQSNWQVASSERILSDTTRYDPYVRVLYQTLETAYATQSLDLLDRFFEAWHRDPTLQPLSSNVALSDTVRAVYDIFRAYADSIFRTGLPFVVLLTSICYTVDDSIESVMSSWHWGDQYLYREGSQYNHRPRLPYRKERIVWILDFRPVYQSRNARILYLGQAYDLALHLFLRPPESESDESYRLLAAESKRRAEFLRSRIPVLRGHNGYYFFFEPQPMIGRVALSKDLVYAEVSYSKGDFWGETSAYIKGAQNWLFLKTLENFWMQ
jgi:hypothetical protein